MNIRKLYKLIKDRKIEEASLIFEKEQLSLKDIEWDMHQDDIYNTIEVKDTLLIIADNILGKYYEGEL